MGGNEVVDGDSGAVITVPKGAKEDGVSGSGVRRRGWGGWIVGRDIVV